MAVSFLRMFIWSSIGHPTWAVAGEDDDWSARSRPSSDDLTRLISPQSAAVSSTLLVVSAVGSSHSEAVGARKAWRLTSTRWQLARVTSRSDFFNNLACLLHAFSDLTANIFHHFYSILSFEVFLLHLCLCWMWTISVSFSLDVGDFSPSIPTLLPNW